MIVRAIEIHLTVNSRPVTLNTDPHRTLLNVLREDMGLVGTKEGCGQGDCGACVVVMNGDAVPSCLVLAPQADQTEIVTVEGLASDGTLHPLQRWFAEKWAFQCGFCTPGMLMSAYALLLHNPNPSPEDIRLSLTGNLCRCTGYEPIIDAIRCAAQESSAVGHHGARRDRERIHR